MSGTCAPYATWIPATGCNRVSREDIAMGMVDHLTTIISLTVTALTALSVPLPRRPSPSPPATVSPG